jgi:hypothetical protein
MNKTNQMHYQEVEEYFNLESLPTDVYYRFNI